MYEDGAAYYELATGQATSAPISCLAFDQHEEAAWFGCSNGWISQSTDGTFSCMELYRNGTQILIGCGQKGLVAYDLISGKSTGQWETEGMGAVALRGPLSGGGYLAASPAGKIFVMDGRSRSVRPGTSLTAHVGGFAAVDAAGSLVATAGYSIRGGHPVLERAVKVFDIRMAPRLLCTLPFGAGPVFLRFHPHLPSTLLAGSASGAVSLLDAAGYGAGTHLSLPGLEQGAGGITCADFSPSGQCIGLGSASGWVHMLGVGSMPSVAGRGAEVPAPPAGNPAPLVSLGEGDPLSRAPLFYNLEGPRPLSSLHPGERASVGLAPRVVDPSLQPLIKWSDFVGVIPNPFYDPAAPPGTAAAASARLRAERAQPACVPVDVAARRAERAQRRAAEGGVVLPDRYRRVLVATQQAAAAQSWFQDYDYSACNASPFVGLENDLANSYCNALVQALFFVPGVRAALLRHVPRSNDEFCLAGELALLFRMLQTRGAVVCRASNLLRALRQSPQALALGLVEGVAGERGAGDIEVEATKERSLARRAKERLAWWKGLQDLPGGPLPSVLAFSCDGQPEGVLLVRQGADLDAMAAPDSMLYELTGVVAHVCDADESLEWGTDLYEGHLVAHIKVSAGGPYWWLFNDFSIQPVPAAEAGELYDGQKVPCLLFYTRRAVDAEERAARMHEEEGLLGTRPTPVLSSLGFQALCRISPLGLRANLRAPTFLPLGPDELPRPGMLLALDAEFVSYSPPQYSLVRGMEVTTRPSRLGLARVSVVRGEGALEGTACIDDYIRSPEAVHDYLTRFSGIVPGDLDPARSPHCLTTLRRAYLKLRYLVDSGVRFVGHGLKQDFRMINILVPSEQIVDTVRLFHKPRMRQLSLRFLASYLLKTSIQSGNHDSIEDAHTALRLYKEYLRLEASGALAWTLDELYNWGKAFGRVVVAMSVLEDVVALVCCADAVRNARQAIQARLREHGARVVQRLSKDVSHVVFERKHVPPSAKRAEPDADLLELYTKLDKLVRHIDKPVLLLKSTPPFKTALPSPGPHSGRRSLLGGIPIPGVERLPSPQVPLPGVCAPGSQGEGTAPTPPSTQPTPSQRAPSPGPRPSPWSAERPWDAPREGARSRRTVAKRARKTTGRVVRQEPAAGAQPCARRARGAKLAAEVPVAEELAGPRDPQPVLLALTSVDKDVAELARSATLRLRGIRLCSSGRGEAGATHLVLGRERRTIKLLLALANGAWLVTPQWITASLDAGEWLPARQFPVGERFRAAAERSRSAREHGATLLAGQRLYIHARTGSGTARPRKSDASVERREGGAASAADLGSLRRLAGALGAELTGPTECSLCILAGDAPRPATLPPAVPSVTSGWLLHAAEHYQVPPVEATWLVA
ncbi:PAB-dependent poly(A)-specific ribonuclease subunit 2 [Auxenochlorella protothecoides]|uniref:PAB-dependent poly(A)-specific ribonuclease subunit 2 n=1 Tax=Auxenochlorella protothecoides TaxID=3075 RepID=A0A087SIG9_AUXPR|nr:PAB-dependent poly(A)-specific ribonuclease subunit 2 [Auxenochlorella protothecoides]KFM25523.1 PAB-dependent poly(A)-specific ribonuclease subunit 2 [Auxenochlorella protothecoides]